jgi:hypothetical protein
MKLYLFAGILAVLPIAVMTSAVWPKHQEPISYSEYTASNFCSFNIPRDSDGLGDPKLSRGWSGTFLWPKRADGSCHAEDDAALMQAARSLRAVWGRDI